MVVLLILLILVICILSIKLGYSWGWSTAHVVVAKECKNFGFFHVGEELFQCVKVTKKPVFEDKPESQE